MTVFTKILAAAAAAGAAAIAAPVAAQPYDDPGAQILQGVVDGLLGNRYNNVNDRRAVRRCANAAVNEAWREYGHQGGGFGRRGGFDRRNGSQMRVTAITDVDRRATGLRVRGEIDSGLLYGGPGRDRRQRVGDLTFRCNIDFRGRISNVRVDRNRNFRPW